MRPPAYARSRYSTVRGKKSCDSLALLAATQVASTIVPPTRTATAPSACLASLPVSRVIRNPLLSTSTVWVIRKIVLAYRPESGERRVERTQSQPAPGPPDRHAPGSRASTPGRVPKPLLLSGDTLGGYHAGHAK